MKFRPWLVATLFTLTATVAAVQQKSDSASKFVALEAKWNDAYKRSDIGAMNSLITDDFIITVEDGATYSKAGYIAHLAATTEHVEVAEITDVQVRVHGDVAVVTGAYYERGTSKGKPYEYRDRFTDVWVGVENTWRILASHYSIPMK